MTGVPESESVGERSYRRIRADIIQGKLAPSEKLTLDRMREDYGASVSTLRELLNRLASEGLVIAEGHRGFEVAPVSSGNLKEIAAMRLLLECHALERSFAAGDIEWEGRVVSAHYKLSTMEKRMISGDAAENEAWKRYDWEFHHALISACGSKSLLESHASIFDKYQRYLMIAMTFRGEIVASEHLALMNFALKRDAARAVRLLTTHIETCVEHTLAAGKIGK